MASCVRQASGLSRLFLPLDSDGTSYEGFVDVSGSQQPELYAWLRVSNVQPPEHGGLVAARLECSPGLAQLLEGREDLLAQRCVRCPTLDALLSELQDMLEESRSLPQCRPRGHAQLLQQQQSVSHAALKHPEYYALLLSELEVLGWSNVASLDEDCSLLTLKSLDVGGRVHKLQLRLPASYPQTAPELAAPLDLPMHAHFKTTCATHQVAHTRAASQQPASQRSHGSISGHLPLIMEQFTTSLSACQDLWDCLEDFDAHAWVLEPVAPSVHSSGATATASSSSSSVNASAATGTRADAGALCSERRLRGGGTCLRRRLMLGQHCSLEVVLDPLHPRRNTMELRFLGPHDVVGAMQERMTAGMDEWDECRMPRENLQQLLGITLPAPPGSPGVADASGRLDSGDGDCAVECAICYAERLPSDTSDYMDASCNSAPEGDLPDLHCPTACCGRAFHRLCLLEWLRGLDDSVLAFGTLFGKCPYCSGAVCVKL